MSPDHSSPSRTPGIWFPLAFMIAVLVLRVLGQHEFVIGLQNLSPLMALAFAGTVVTPRPLPWWSWAFILLALDSASQHASVWQPEHLPVIALSYACYTFAAWWAGRLRPVAGVLDTLAGTLACSVLFYLATNTFCWMTEPSYAKTFADWVQCLTVGTPGPWPTTLVFFRNSLIADMAGAGVLLLAYNGEAFIRGMQALPWTGMAKAKAALA